MPTKPRKPIASYTAAELSAIAERCEALAAQGLIVEPESVLLVAEAFRAFARERARGAERR